MKKITKAKVFRIPFTASGNDEQRYPAPPGVSVVAFRKTFVGVETSMRNPLILLLLSLAAAPSAAQEMVLDRATAMKAASGPATQGAVAVVSAYAKRGDAPGLIASARRLAANPDLEPAGRDRLYAEAARALAVLPDHAESRGFLEELANRESAVWIPVEETAGHVQLPLYDFAAQARYSLRALDVRAAADAMSARVNRDDPGLAREARDAGPNSVFRDGLARALTEARPTTALAASLAHELRGDPTLGRLALAARDPADDTVLMAVIQNGDLESSLRAVTLTRSRPSADALAMLQQAAERQDLASAAILEAGGRQAENPAVTGWLESLLGDPQHGASAAASLARRSDSALVDRVAARLAREPDDLTARHLVLVLRLSGTPAADRAMAGLRNDPAVPAAIRGELR
jgi:hypothetical protein